MTFRVAMITVGLALVGCAAPDDSCFDEDDNPVACEYVEDNSELAEVPVPPEAVPGLDAIEQLVPGPDDLDGALEDAIEEPLASDDELADYAVLPRTAAASTASTAIDFGRTDTAERRKFLPVGRTAGVSRFVVMRLRPSDLPNLAQGDTLRAAAELQVTTRCDIGQAAPGCDYTPHIRLQLVLSGNAKATSPKAGIALSDVKRFECTKDEHHCVKIINFSDATLKLAGAPHCVADNSCFINLVAWAYHPDARSNGQDKLLLGANEGDFLANNNIEQDRGRIMAIRERDLTAADVAFRVTKHDVRSGPIDLASNGDSKRIYSHTLNAGGDLKAGQKFRVWADVDASSNNRVNLSLEMFLTKNRLDKNGGAISDTSPKAISEHNGTNCSPGNDCHLRKVAVFAIDRDIRGPVYVNIAASTEVPGPGSATTTIHDSGSVKVLRYAR